MKSFEWTVVGGGPAGIAAVGKLIDHGIQPHAIGWIDPKFQVGDFGEKWGRVSSNTKVKFFIKFLENCHSFQYKNSPDFTINGLDAEETCFLGEVADPLQWITNHLKEKAHPFKTKATSLILKNREWELTLSEETIRSKNVILAVGAIPKKLNHAAFEEIPLEIALNDEKLQQISCKGETIAVFGSSHSSMIVLQNLLKMGVKKVYNFYICPTKYAFDMGDWILFDNTGLKGESAKWAREHIDGKCPEMLERYHLSDPKFQECLSSCTKVVYTVGFERRTPPSAPQFPDLHYNDRNGIIAPGLFGLGIAFPEKVEDPFGNEEYNVGLWKFMKYINKVLPLWMRYAP